MKISKPDGGLDLLTILWVIYGAAIFWLVPDWRLSLFSLLLACGILASVGVWLNIRPSGYIFASASLVGAVLAAAVMAGFLVPDRPFSFRDLCTVGCLLYCAYAGLKWAQGGSHSLRSKLNSDSENAG